MVFPGGRKRFDLSVVPGKSVDSGLNENKSEFAVSVSSELFNVLSDVNGLLNETVEVFWQSGGESVYLQKSENFGASNTLNLRDTILVSEDNTNLRWSRSLSSKFANLLNEISS